MSLRNLRSRLAWLIERSPPRVPLDFLALAGAREPMDPTAEVVPGCGFSWAEAQEPTPITDVVQERVAALPPPLPPESRADVGPGTTPEQEPAFPPGYEPEPAEPFARQGDDTDASEDDL